MLRALLLSILLAAPSGAAILIVTTDQPSYQVGDTITLTATGDLQGMFGQQFYAQLAFDDPSVADFAGGTPVQNVPVMPVPPPLFCTPSSCEMFNFIPTIPTSFPAVSTVSFIATAPGVSNAPGTC